MKIKCLYCRYFLHKLLAITELCGILCHCKRGWYGRRPDPENTPTMEAKMDKAVIKDTERGEELTLTDLREEYETLKNAGETEAETFEDYLENITDGNGTCEWL